MFLRNAGLTWWNTTTTLFLMLWAFLTTYPWDLIDEDLGMVLDRLHGEVGVTGVSVWIASPPLVQLRAREVEPRVYRTRGGLFFHPDEQHYTATRLKPIVSGWVKTKDPLKRIANACAERGMELRVIVSAAMVGRLAQRHPETACKNVFGAQSYVSVCLSNPDVQTYLCGLVSDLSTNYDLTGVTITDLCIAWGEAYGTNLRVEIPLGEAERSLLSTCFCESCEQRATAADVDVAMARRSTQTTLQECFDRPMEDRLSDLFRTPGASRESRFHRDLNTIIADNAPLTAYYRWRTEELSSLLRRVTESCKCELLLDRRLEGPEREQHNDLDWSLPTAVITQVDQSVKLTSALCSSARRNELRLPEAFVVGLHGPELVSTLSQAVECGFAGVEIDNYGLLPDAALTSIKQAIRFARRTTSQSSSSRL